MSSLERVQFLANQNGWKHPHPVIRLSLLASQGPPRSRSFAAAILASVFPDTSNQHQDALAGEKAVRAIMNSNFLNSAGSTHTEVIRELTRSCVLAGLPELPIELAKISGAPGLIQEVRTVIEGLMKQAGLQAKKPHSAYAQPGLAGPIAGNLPSAPPTPRGLTPSKPGSQSHNTPVQSPSPQTSTGGSMGPNMYPPQQPIIGPQLPPKHVPATQPSAPATGVNTRKNRMNGRKRPK